MIATARLNATRLFTLHNPDDRQAALKVHGGL